MSPKAQPYAMLYGKREGSMEVYIGAALLEPGESPAQALARFKAMTLGEWFQDCRTIVHNLPRL